MSAGGFATAVETRCALSAAPIPPTSSTRGMQMDLNPEADHHTGSEPNPNGVFAAVAGLLAAAFFSFSSFKDPTSILYSNERLATSTGEVIVCFIALLSATDRAQGRVVGEKSGPTDLNCRLDPAVLVHPSMFNATESCAYCNERLTTPSDNVIVYFIALLSASDRAQGRVVGEKKRADSPELSPRSGGVGASKYVQCIKALRKL